MKNITLILSIITIATCCLQAQLRPQSPSRTWTQKSSGKTIEARPSFKNSDSSEIHVINGKGKTLRLKTATLSDDDQEFIKEWTPPVEHLTVRIVGSGKGYKMIEIEAKAGSHPIEVKTKPTHPYQTTHSQKIAKGKSMTYRVKVKPEYTATALKGTKNNKGGMTYSEPLDQETHHRKTGL